MMTQIHIEYLLKTSPRIIYNHISTPWGLAEWFADSVGVQENRYVFSWRGGEQVAEILDQKEDTFIRFRWIDEEEELDEDIFFEFAISKDDITNESVLSIVDFADSPEDVTDLIDLWNSQIDTLKKVLGI